MKITIKKDSEAAKAFESLREDKQEFKENVQSGKIMIPEIKNVPPEVEKLYELAEESWEGCDGCDENDKYFFIKGFQAGYNRAKPDEISAELRYKDGIPMRKYNSPKLQAIEMEISDEEIEKAAKECRFEDLDISVGSFELGAKWYREQLKQTK
jgi:hypothetical protein